MAYIITEMPFCTQCGNQVADVDAFCAKCGRAQAPTGTARAGFSAPQPPRQPFSGSDPFANLSPHVASILCYIPTVGWIFAVIVLASQKFKQEHIARFHAFQGLYLFAIWLMVQWVVHPIMIASSNNAIRVDRGLEGLVVGVSIFMLIKASQGDAYVLPIIGELAQRSANEQ